MSFEGYYQRLCRMGHSLDADVYIANDNDLCWCGQPIEWAHLVDQTNDSGNPYKLEIDQQNKCECCGSILQTRYKIPNKVTL